MTSSPVILGHLLTPSVRYTFRCPVIRNTVGSGSGTKTSSTKTHWPRHQWLYMMVPKKLAEEIMASQPANATGIEFYPFECMTGLDEGCVVKDARHYHSVRMLKFTHCSYFEAAYNWQTE